MPIVGVVYKEDEQSSDKPKKPPKSPEQSECVAAVDRFEGWRHKRTKRLCDAETEDWVRKRGKRLRRMGLDFAQQVRREADYERHCRLSRADNVPGRIGRRRYYDDKH